MIRYEGTSTDESKRLRYCREVKGWCYNANWYGECSLTACNKKRFAVPIGTSTRSIVIDAAKIGVDTNCSEKPNS